MDALYHLMDRCHFVNCFTIALFVVQDLIQDKLIGCIECPCLLNLF